MGTPRSQWKKAVLTVVALVVLGGLVLGATWLYTSQQVPPQPLEFNHQVHVQQLGLSCLFCHSNAARGKSAGLPTTNRCMGCHAQLEPKTEAEKILREYYEKKEPIPWVPVAIQPDFVYFSHQPHVSKGIACETCHGEVGQYTIAPNLSKKQNMGWCLSCHKNLAPEHFTGLSSCETCHK